LSFVSKFVIGKAILIIVVVSAEHYLAVMANAMMPIELDSTTKPNSLIQSSNTGNLEYNLLTSDINMHHCKLEGLPLLSVICCLFTLIAGMVRACPLNGARPLGKALPMS
jgi:hypothetical protein